MTKDLIERLEARLRLAEQHGPLGEQREVYIPSSWLPQILAALKPGEGEPVAWQVKDYADGWITFFVEANARAESAVMGGALIRPLYTRPEGYKLVPVEALEEVRDLLMERRHGNPARSPGHNARLAVEFMLSPSAGQVEGEKG